MTCLHAFHRVAEKNHKSYPDVDNLIANIKTVLKYNKA